MNISADLFFAQGTIPQNAQTLKVQVNTYTFYLLLIVYTNPFLWWRWLFDTEYNIRKAIEKVAFQKHQHSYLEKILT